MKEYKLIENKRTTNRIYYKLYKNNELVGNAWITKKYRYLFNGLYIYIKPTLRRKGYGREFYNLLLQKLSDNDVEMIAIWVNKNNTDGLKFLNKVVCKYADRLKFMNKIGFVETLIEE